MGEHFSKRFPGLLAAICLALSSPALAGGNQAQNTGSKTGPNFTSRPAQTQIMLIQATDHILDLSRLYYRNTDLKIADIEAFTQMAQDNPREAARAEAAKLLLGLLAHPEEIHPSRGPLRAALGADRVSRIEDWASDLRFHSGTAQALLSIRDKYSAQDINAVLARLNHAYDGWFERWSEAEPAEEKGYLVRRYILEKPKGDPHARVARRLTIPADQTRDKTTYPISLERAQLRNPVWRLDPVSLEHAQLKDAVFMQNFVLEYAYFSPLPELSALVLSSVMAAGGLIAAAAGVFVSFPYWSLAGFFLSAPILGAALTRGFTEGIYYLSVGLDDHRPISAKEAMERLGQEGKLLAKIQRWVRTVAAATGAVSTALFLSASSALIAGWLPWLAQFQTSAPIRAKIICILGILLTGALIGFSWGLSRCRRIAELTLEMVRLKGLEREGT